MSKWRVYYSSVSKEACICIPASDPYGWLGSYFKNNTSYFLMKFNLFQEEINDILAEMEKLGKAAQPSITLSPDTQLDFGIKTPECEHKFIPYIGLKEKFDYCEKCDKKK